MAEQLKPGMEIWLDCDTSPGPLNERLVRVKIGPNRWFGFVKNSEISENGRQLRAKVIDINSQVVTIGIRGHSPTSNNAIKTKKESFPYRLGAIA
ncbi:MAG TPA: hypothetical protein VKT27_07855 [Candidatus Binataceae bacterium]|nr:hypothetical protein [Candidatus Binataceae bacterium]